MVARKENKILLMSCMSAGFDVEYNTVLQNWFCLVCGSELKWASAGVKFADQTL